MVRVRAWSPIIGIAPSTANSTLPRRATCTPLIESAGLLQEWTGKIEAVALQHLARGLPQVIGDVRMSDQFTHVAHVTGQLSPVTIFA